MEALMIVLVLLTAVNAVLSVVVIAVVVEDAVGVPWVAEVANAISIVNLDRTRVVSSPLRNAKEVAHTTGAVSRMRLKANWNLLLLKKLLRVKPKLLPPKASKPRKEKRLKLQKTKKPRS